MLCLLVAAQGATVPSMATGELDLAQHDFEMEDAYEELTFWPAADILAISWNVNGDEGDGIPARAAWLHDQIQRQAVSQDGAALFDMVGLALQELPPGRQDVIEHFGVFPSDGAFARVYHRLDYAATANSLKARRIGAAIWVRKDDGAVHHAKDMGPFRRVVTNGMKASKGTVSLHTDIKIPHMRPGWGRVGVTFSSSHLDAYDGPATMKGIEAVTKGYKTATQDMIGSLLHIWCGDWNPRFLLRTDPRFDGTETFDGKVKKFNVNSLGVMLGEGIETLAHIPEQELMPALYRQLHTANRLKGELTLPGATPGSTTTLFHDDYLDVQIRNNEQCAAFTASPHFRGAAANRLQTSDTGYHEGAVAFTPTYPTRDDYDVEKPRIPGFADRCFVRLESAASSGNTVEVLRYGSLPCGEADEGCAAARLSDHIPIFAVIRVDSTKRTLPDVRDNGQNVGDNPGDDTGLGRGLHRRKAVRRHGPRAAREKLGRSERSDFSEPALDPPKGERDNGDLITPTHGPPTKETDEETDEEEQAPTSTYVPSMMRSLRFKHPRRGGLMPKGQTPVGMEYLDELSGQSSTSSDSGGEQAD